MNQDAWCENSWLNNLCEPHGNNEKKNGYWDSNAKCACLPEICVVYRHPNEVPQFWENSQCSSKLYSSSWVITGDTNFDFLNERNVTLIHFPILCHRQISPLFPSSCWFALTFPILCHRQISHFFPRSCWFALTFHILCHRQICPLYPRSCWFVLNFPILCHRQISRLFPSSCWFALTFPILCHRQISPLFPRSCWFVLNFPILCHRQISHFFVLEECYFNLSPKPLLVLLSK